MAKSSQTKAKKKDAKGVGGAGGGAGQTVGRLSATISLLMKPPHSVPRLRSEPPFVLPMGTPPFRNACAARAAHAHRVPMVVARHALHARL